jgi:hypothetical protein
VIRRRSAWTPGPCLSWGSRLFDRPSTDTSNARPLPGRDPLGTRNRRLRRAMGRRHHPASLVPPSWFRTTSTVSSARRTAGLLHPAASPGVRRVSLKPATMAPNPRPRRLRVVVAGHRSGRGQHRGGSGLAPRDASYPSKSSPVHSRAASPRSDAPLPLDRSRSGRSTRFPLPVGGGDVLPGEPSTSRLFSANGSVASGTLAGTWIARSFHGLVSPTRRDRLRSLPDFLARPGASEEEPGGRP